MQISVHASDRLIANSATSHERGRSRDFKIKAILFFYAIMDSLQVEPPAAAAIRRRP
jgi:hypothetical protein